MFRKIYFLSLFLISGIGVMGQSSTANNAIYLELLGNAGVYSLNYERAISPDFNIRVGFGTSSGGWFSHGETYIVSFPVMGNYLFGNGNNKFELGGGVLVGSKEVDYGANNLNNIKFTIFDLTGVLGYRYQKPSGGFLFRIGVIPFLALSGGENAYPAQGFSLSGGISFGYAF